MIRSACDCNCDCGEIDLASVELSPMCFESDPAAFELSFSGQWRVAVMNGVMVPLERWPDGTSRAMLCQVMLDAIGPIESAEIRLMN